MSFILDFLLGNPYVPWLVGLVIALYLYRRFAGSVRFRIPGIGFSGGDLLGKVLGPGYAKGQIQREASKLRKGGQFLAAGKLLEENDQASEAIDVYIEGGEFWAAAAGLEKLNRLDKAADLYLQAGDYKKAAQVYSQSNKPAKAAA